MDYKKASAAIGAASKSELDAIMSLSLGRILKLGSRATRPGDVDQYEDYKWLFTVAGEELKHRA